VPAATWDRARRLTAAVLPGVGGQRVGERVHKIGGLMAAGSTGDMYRSLLSAWQQRDRIAGDWPAAGDDENGGILDGSEPAHLLDRMMLADQTTYLPDDLLAKVDRASMAVSLEVRAPLLDHRVVEFSWRLPPSLKLRGGVGKWALRQVLYKRVPRDLIERPKMGFSVPIDRWLRGPLRPWAESLVLSDSLGRDGWLDAAAVGRAWTALQDNRRPAGAGLWAVIMLQAWRERWQV
jgi:asparagine synthase (glutamine-hydrolysing)